jgi:hypothetical protein
MTQQGVVRREHGFAALSCARATEKSRSAI